jgi:Cof subfamily protein (haloacid dehalogenase superfamily)
MVNFKWIRIKSTTQISKGQVHTMIQCIATDMDGTLLDPQQKITEENRKALLLAQEMGIEVVVATGRSYKEAVGVLNEAGISCSIIGVNGAEVRDENGTITHTAGLASKEAAEVAKGLEKHGLYYEVYTNKGTYTKSHEMGIEILVNIVSSTNPEFPHDKIREGAEKRFGEGHVETIDDYQVIFDSEDFVVYKLLVFSLDPTLLKKAWENLSSLKGIAVSSSGVDNLEITQVNAQKGIALERFVKEKGLDLANTMALGDNFNDLSMMKVVGRPVAMGNAAEEIKQFCRYQTATNRESGVAKAIYEALGMKKEELVAK